METVLTYYFFIALIAFGMWFAIFLNDSTTPLDDRVSWIVLVLASLFWPITLPSSIIKLATIEYPNRSLSVDE
ncbi:MAG: hypothetical protein SWJ54_00760 [Cyanobacteriota bacterium]|nr:hypothetical protein [Cyanobacteriota bacterium]